MKHTILSISVYSALAFDCDLVYGEKTEEGIEEVVVTSAQKRSESITSVPIAIDIFDEAFIENAGASGLSDLELSAPSVNFGRGGRKSRGEIVIRGIGDFSRNIGTDPRVAVYIDDVPLGRSSAFNIDLLDIKQVEILKGPQGTLFGTNTVAGAINVITNPPGKTLANKLHADVGNRNRRLFSVQSNLPFNDKAAGSLHLSSHNADGFIDNITKENLLQGDNKDTARLKVKYDHSKQLQMSFNADWLSESVEATNAEALGTTSTPEPFRVAHDADEFENRDIRGGSVVFDYKLNSGADFKSISAYRYSAFEELSEEDYGANPAFDVTSTFDEEYDQWTQEFRYISPKRDRFHYVAGVYLASQDTSTTRSAALNGAITRTPGELSAQTYSIYTTLTYQMTQILELNLGVRAQTEEKDITYQIEDGIGLFTNGTLEDSLSDSEILPKISLDAHLAEESLLYGSISRGTKSGGWNADFVISLDDLYFEPEYSTNYEIGYKSRYMNGKLNLSMAAFLTEFTDYQVFQFTTVGESTTTILTNAAEATSQGLELSVDTQLNAHFGVSFSAAYTDAKFDQFADGLAIGEDADGNSLPYAPEFTAFVALNGNHPLWHSGEFFYHLNYSYSDGYSSSANNTAPFSIDSYYTVNGRLGLTFNDQWKVAIWGKNLNDDTYLRYRDVSFLSIERGFYEAPRSYGVSLTFTQG